MKVITYHSENAKPSEAWLGYLMLPNDNKWMVHFMADTEDAVKQKAIAFYEAEKAKYADDAVPSNDGWPELAATGRGAHFAGKAWLIHKITREKIRVPQEQVERYLSEYERGGPRSK